MLECPIDYFKDNLIFNVDKSCWAVFVLNGYDYDLLSNEAKLKVLHKLMRFIVGVATEAKILIVPVAQSIGEHFKMLRERLLAEDPLYEYAQHHSQKTERYLLDSVKSSGQINDYQTVVCIKLQLSGESDIVSTIKDLKDYFIKDITNAVNVFMSLDKKDILKSKLERFEKLSEKFFNEQNVRLQLEPATAEKVQWLLTRMPYRGLNKDFKLFHKSNTEEWQPQVDELSVGKESIIRPYKRDIQNIFRGVIKKGNRMLKIEHDDKSVSYQTFLVITNIPDTLEFPGCEWIYMLQKLNSKAEICIHIQNLEHRESLRKIDEKKREISSQIEHIGNANGDIPDELLEGKEYATYLEKELKEAKYPIVKTAITICVASDSLEDLETRATDIKQKFEDLNFGIERPLTDQFALYLQLIPSTGFCVKDFIIRLTPIMLASGIFGATHELGDYSGGYIGTTGREKKHVFLSLAEACKKNSSAVATFFGNLGAGKSFNANLLLLLHIIYGGYGLVFDPKGERTHWVKDLKMLDGLITLVTLSPDPKYKGSLDPFNIYRDNIEEACELALNVLTELFNIHTQSKEYMALLVGISEIKKVENPSMLKLAELLKSFDKNDSLKQVGEDLARSIVLQKEAGMAKLLFGDGTEQAITFKNRLNILQIEGLELPSPDTPKSAYSREEMLSAVLMMVMSNFAKKFVLSLKGMFKIVLIDESYMLGKTVQGEKLFTFLTRMSRSLYSSIILNGHSVQDIPTEGIRNSVTYKFCFRTDNINEAKRMLQYMNLEETPGNIAIIQNLGNGQCLFQDLRKHVGILQFDAVFNDLIKVFSTTPVDAKDLANMEIETQEYWPDTQPDETDDESNELSDILNDPEINWDTLDKLSSENEHYEGDTEDDFDVMEYQIDIYAYEVPWGEKDVV